MLPIGAHIRWALRARAETGMVVAPRDGNEHRIGNAAQPTGEHEAFRQRGGMPRGTTRGGRKPRSPASERKLPPNTDRREALQVGATCASFHPPHRAIVALCPHSVGIAAPAIGGHPNLHLGRC